VVLTHLHVLNKTGVSVQVSTWKGLTGANASGTEWPWSAVGVPANNYLDWYGSNRFSNADFLVGGASAAASLTINGEGEIGIGA
jgi:hypothetical protein